MTLESWLTFVFASVILLAIPGPTVMIVVSYAIGVGRGSIWATVPGVVLGDITAMTLSLLGAGAVLATSAVLFTLLKIVGAGYLIWLGISLWRSQPVAVTAPSAPERTSKRRMFWNCFFVTALNPKSIVFFIAFVTQFVDTQTGTAVQFALLGGTFLTLAALAVTLWALGAAQVQRRFRNPKTMGVVNKIGGGFLIGAGLLTAMTRRLN